MPRNRLLLLLAMPGLLAGCADYLNNYEGVTLAAGDTQKQNMLLQTANPFNPQSNDTAIGTDGVRAAKTMEKYQAMQAPTTDQSNGASTNGSSDAETSTGL